jgi:hypothetical protein
MEPGDRVEAFGNVGTIKRVSESGLHFIVKFDDCEDLMVFYLDGKLFKWNVNPILKKIDNT